MALKASSNHIHVVVPIIIVVVVIIIIVVVVVCIAVVVVVADEVDRQVEQDHQEGHEAHGYIDKDINLEVAFEDTVSGH